METTYWILQTLQVVLFLRGPGGLQFALATEPLHLLDLATGGAVPPTQLAPSFAVRAGERNVKLLQNEGNIVNTPRLDANLPGVCNSRAPQKWCFGIYSTCLVVPQYARTRTPVVLWPRHSTTLVAANSPA